MAHEKSDHFDGTHFFNPWGNVTRGFLDVLRWQLTSERTPWPKFVDNTAKPKVARNVPEGEAHLTFINHVTYLIQLPGVNVLTDPVFSERASPFPWAGPKRHRNPGLLFDELPQIDVVLVSHNHYDHMDLPYLKKLSDRFAPRVLVPLGNKRILDSADIKNANEMDWWDKHSLLHSNSLEITLVPAQHWSSRSPFDRNRALWGGFILAASGLRIYFAGDTGYHGPLFKEIRERAGPLDLSLLPIGAYEPRWFMKPQHMNPDDAAKAHIDLESKLTVGMHYGCFQLTDEGIDTPIIDLQTALRERNIPCSDFQAPETGTTYVIKSTLDR